MKRDLSDIEIIVYICGLIILLMLAFYAIKITQERQRKCEAENGYFYFDRSGGICLRKNSVIKP